MTKFIVISVFILMLCVWVFISSVRTITSNHEAISKELATNVGRKFILNKDTVVIVNYSVFNGSYTLDNGTEVSITIIKSLKEVK